MQNEDGLVAFFEAVIQDNSERDPQKIVNWIETELLRCLNEYDLHVAER